MKSDFIWQPATTSSVFAQRSSKAIPKAKLAPKQRVMVTGGLLLVWSTTSFWIQTKPFHLRSVLSKSMGCTKNCNTYNWHWWTERALFSSTTTPDYTLNNNASKVERFGPWRFASSAIFTWALTNQLQLLRASRQLFAGKTFPQPAEGRKCFPRVHQILKHAF